MSLRIESLYEKVGDGPGSNRHFKGTNPESYQLDDRHRCQQPRANAGGRAGIRTPNPLLNRQMLWVVR